MIALHWRPALGSLTGTGRRQRSERRSPSTDFALPPGSPSGPGTQTGPGTADWLYWRPQAQAHASPPSLSRLDSCGPGTRARPPLLPTPCPTRSDFFALRTCRPAVSRRVSALSPAPPPRSLFALTHPRSLPYRCSLSLVPIPLPSKRFTSCATRFRWPLL